MCHSRDRDHDSVWTNTHGGEEEEEEEEKEEEICPSLAGLRLARARGRQPPICQ